MRAQYIINSYALDRSTIKYKRVAFIIGYESFKGYFKSIFKINKTKFIQKILMPFATSFL
jgi:hypothetical protein